MPAQPRTNKLIKAKENILGQNVKSQKNVGLRRRQRVPLADKTNSTSGNNTSIEVKSKASNKTLKVNIEETMRPRRDRRLPSRFNDNQLLINLSNASIKEGSPVKQLKNPSKITKTKKANTRKSPNNTSVDNLSSKKKVDGSLVQKRHRIHELPAKFENKVISPVKSPQVQHKNPSKKSQVNAKNLNVDKKVVIRRNPVRTQVKPSKSDLTKNSNQIKSPGKIIKDNADKNNNPNARKQSRIIASKDKDKTKYNINFSYRLLEKQKAKSAEEKLAVYEFTFNPAEEPVPQKKKRKRIIRKKTEPKFKNIFVSDNYNKNLTKTLASLKNIIIKKTGSEIVSKGHAVAKNASVLETAPVTSAEHVKTVDKPSTPVTDQNINTNDASEPLVSVSPANELQQDHFVDNINYSPATSPAFHRDGETSATNETRDLEHTTVKNVESSEEISFLEAEPIASSSMNLSLRIPKASPWRAEFNNLPIKWATNTYVKPDMTPAVESSFMHFENGKKHVYTNILTDVDMPEIVNTSDNSNLKQSTLLSFFKEVCCDKKKSKKYATPRKKNSIFEDSPNVTTAHVHADTPIADDVVEETAINVKTPSKRKISVTEDVPSKTRKDATPTVDDYFGFDESTLNDQENISPDGKIEKPVGMKTRSKVLGEINRNAAPFRANIPKIKEKVLKEQVIEELQEKLAPEYVEPEDMGENINASDSSSSEEEEEEEVEEDRNMEKEGSPIPLFEDIEVFHYNKVNYIILFTRKIVFILKFDAPD